MERRAVAIITGAQQGIGAATAKTLAAEGWLCIVNYLDDAGAARAIADEIAAAGGEAIPVRADISDGADVENLLKAASQHGELKALVNNAAIFPRRPLLEMADAEWDAVLSVNLRGAFLCLRGAGRLMRETGGGVIVNVASLAAARATPRGAHYTAAKAGLLGLTRAAALELAPHAIRVNAVAPGLTDTAQPRFGMTEDEISIAAEAIPLGQLAQPGDIAAAIAFLCGSGATHITGQVLHVNGGQYFA
jgi:Dehydrogenases with different specificities (related to short-chain alcohol dehydrogenases)